MGDCALNRINQGRAWALMAIYLVIWQFAIQANCWISALYTAWKELRTVFTHRHPHIQVLVLTWTVIARVILPVMPSHTAFSTLHRIITLQTFIPTIFAVFISSVVSLIFARGTVITYIRLPTEGWLAATTIPTRVCFRIRVTMNTCSTAK